MCRKSIFSAMQETVTVSSNISEVGEARAPYPRVLLSFVLGGEELVEFGEAAVVVGLVDDFFGGLEMVGDGWLVLV